MRKLLFFVMGLAVLAACSGHASTLPSHDTATGGGARAPRSIGGAGTVTLTYNDTYAPVGQCSPGVLTINNGSVPATSLSFPAGQGPQLVVSNCNFSTPQNVTVTLSVSSGYPYIRQDGYAVTIDAFGPAVFTATFTAASGVSGSVNYTIGSPVDFRTLWQTAVSAYTTPGPDDGQCASQPVVINGNNVVSHLVRNTSGPNGTSTCYRSQINPTDPDTGDSPMLFSMGKHYTFHFQTVVALNGNHSYLGDANGNFYNDIPAIVWQTHPYVSDAANDTGPCAQLTIDNSARAANVSSLYPGAQEPGQPTWNFFTCSDTEFGPTAYNSPIWAPATGPEDSDTSNWQIDIDAQYNGQGGHITVVKNGDVVYDRDAGVCLSPSPNNGCWWNFGAYFHEWGDTQYPSTENSAGVTVKVRGMALTTPTQTQTLGRKRHT